MVTGYWSPDRRLGLGLHRQSLHRPQVLGPATEQRSDLPRYPGSLLVLTLDTGYNVDTLQTADLAVLTVLDDGGVRVAQEALPGLPGAAAGEGHPHLLATYTDTQHPHTRAQPRHVSPPSARCRHVTGVQPPVPGLGEGGAQHQHQQPTLHLGGDIVQSAGKVQQCNRHLPSVVS